MTLEIDVVMIHESDRIFKSTSNKIKRQAYPKTRKRKARKRKKIFENENADTKKNFEILKFQGVFGII